MLCDCRFFPHVEDMKKRAELTGLEEEAMRAWLQAFVRRAKRDPKAVTKAELDELARIVALLTPVH